MKFLRLVPLGKNQIIKPIYLIFLIIIAKAPHMDLIYVSDIHFGHPINFYRCELNSI